MHEAVKEGYGGGGGLRRWDHSTGDWGIVLWVSPRIAEGELSFGVGLDLYMHRFAGGFGHGG